MIMSQIETSDQYFDLAFLFEIADGATEFIVESIDMFLQQTPELMTTIYNAIQAKDAPVIAGAAHKLKPNLGFFGMHIAQAMMQELESMAKNGEDFTAIEAKYIAIRSILKPTLDKLKLIKAEKEKEI